jgi:hypothetical protein
MLTKQVFVHVPSTESKTKSKHRWKINHFKMWQNSDMWEQRYQMQINRNKEIKHRLHSGNACCQLHQDILSSHLLSKNTQTTI